MAVFTLRVLHLCRLFRAGPDVTNPTTPLFYRDVFVLTRDDSDLQDDVIGDAGQVTSPASGFVRGLRAEGVPVCVLEGSDRVGGRVGRGTRVGSRVSNVAAVGRAGGESRVGDVAVSRTDRVTVADWRCVRGLERRVVVWLTDWRGDLPVESYHGLLAKTRCTTQLVVVSAPDDSDTHHTHTPHTHHQPTERRRRGRDDGVTATRMMMAVCRGVGRVFCCKC